MNVLTRQYKYENQSMTQSTGNCLKILCWNVEGGLNQSYNRHPMVKKVIQDSDCDYLLAQEAAGLSGGYQQRNNAKLSNIIGMNNITTDLYGTTAIYTKDRNDKQVEILFPDDLFTTNYVSI